MKITGREVIDVIEGAVLLDWFRYTKFESDKGLHMAPVVAWRFDLSNSNNEQSKDLILIIRSVIDSFSGNVDWIFKAVAKNWILMPSRIQELEDTGRFRTDGEVLNYLAESEPNFGVNAYADLVAIAQEISKRLK